MPTIILETEVQANCASVFDLSRSIDLHLQSTKQTNETAIAGKTSGLIEMGEWVTWRAKHLGFYQNLTSEITHFKAPYFFVDEQKKGIFKHFKHEHFFEETHYGTLMKDVFYFESPFGLIGKLANILFLTAYLKSFLKKRNDLIKQVAESKA